MEKETIFLQFGPLAGHTMTHFWNIQSDYMLNHTLPRNGLFSLTSNGTLLPRSVMVDSKKGTGGRNIVNPWNTGGEGVEAWNKVDRIDKTLQNQYMDAVDAGTTWDEDIGYKSSIELGVEQVADAWPNYSKVYHHQRSSVICNSSAGSELAWDKELHIDWDNGTMDVWESDLLDEVVLESLRFQMESADNLQSMHVVVDVFSKWYQVCHGVLQHLRDDGMRVDVIAWALDDVRVWPVRNASTVSTVLQKESQRNKFAGIYSMAQVSTVVVPLGKPGTGGLQPGVDWSKPWQIGSVMASLIDTCFYGLQCGLKPNHLPLSALSASYPMLDNLSNLWNYSSQEPAKFDGRFGTCRGLAVANAAVQSPVAIPLYDAYPRHFPVPMDNISVYAQWDSPRSFIERQLRVVDVMSDFEEVNGWYQDELDHFG